MASVTTVKLFIVQTLGLAKPYKSVKFYKDGSCSKQCHCQDYKTFFFVTHYEAK